jgi:hypothetical protein
MGVLSMDRQRRYLAWLLALIAATALLCAGIRGAQVAPDALRQLVLFKLAPYVMDMRDTLVLAGIALLAGTCAILIAPQRTIMIYRIISDKHEKGIDVRDVQPGRSNMHLMRLDARARTFADRATWHSAHNKRPA